jgi:hypothetical protein
MANKPMTYANTNKIKLLYNIAMKKYYKKLIPQKISNEILVFNTKDNKISVYASDTTLYINVLKERHIKNFKNSKLYRIQAVPLSHLFDYDVELMQPAITITDKHTISALSKQEMDRIINKVVKEMIAEI